MFGKSKGNKADKPVDSFRQTPQESVANEQPGLLGKLLFRGEPDPFKPGVLIALEGRKLRVITADKDTVTLNVDGTPTVWQREWLNNYDNGHLHITKPTVIHQQ